MYRPDNLIPGRDSLLEEIPFETNGTLDPADYFGGYEDRSGSTGGKITGRDVHRAVSVGIGILGVIVFFIIAMIYLAVEGADTAFGVLLGISAMMGTAAGWQYFQR